LLIDDFNEFDRVCGLDVAYSDDFAFSALAIHDFATMDLMEVKTWKTRLSFPYVPTYLALREFDAMEYLARNLNRDGDLVFVDGNGILHPRKLGLASHLGIRLDLVTAGIAKSLLCGNLIETPRKPGDYSEVVHEGEILGYGLRTSMSKRLLYVSPGHRISLESSLLFTKRFMKNRMPEPLTVAHNSACNMK
jgi:deoxyribonuclease V